MSIIAKAPLLSAIGCRRPWSRHRPSKLYKNPIIRTRNRVLLPNLTPGYHMLSAAPLLCVLYLALVSHARLEAQQNRTHSDFLDTCHKIATGISSASQVYFPRAYPIPLPVAF